MHKVDPRPYESRLGPLSAGRSELWLPSAALVSCMRAVIVRDTRAVALSDEQRYNHFPAAPVCSIAWYLSGSGELLDGNVPASPGSGRSPVPPVMFCGPFTRPVTTWNPGPMHAIMLLLLPDAMSLLTGIDPGAYLNRVLPVEEVLDDCWVAMCEAVGTAPDDAQRVQAIESFLHPLWQQARPKATLAGRYLSDWSQSLALRAATSGLGRSMRQAERRIKQWTGRPLRELRGLGRSEDAFFDALAALVKNGSVKWSEVASNTGYSDQAHMCRETRRVTGFAPEELRRRILSEEGFWPYRLWGIGESIPGD